MSVAVIRLHRTAGAEHQSGRLVIASFVARSSLRGAATWGAVFGLWVVATIKAFVAGYPTITSRLEVARSLGHFRCSSAIRNTSIQWPALRPGGYSP